MSPHEVLIMAVTRMQTGVCMAGFIETPHLQSRLTWIRPVKKLTLRLDDITDATGRIVQMGDFVQFHLLHPAPAPVHVEDWLTDFTKQRPVITDRLKGINRAIFLREHIDLRPSDVLHYQTRSLCLIKPESIWVNFFHLNAPNTYQARLGFTLDGVKYPKKQPAKGFPVTDLRWRALGRLWLSKGNPVKPVVSLGLSQAALLARLSATEIFLSIGLSRPFLGKLWPLIVGVHVIPDYDVAIDYNNL